MARLVHPSFATPRGPTKIWRYLTTAKFVDMLQSKTLWFSRADLLGDPFEGSLTVPIYDEERAALALKEDKSDNLDNSLESESHRTIAVRNMYINCWHMNERESAAMWGLYAPHNESVAIVADFDSLHSSLPDQVYLGMVEYIDYEKDKFPAGNVYNPFMNKRASFAHENELRAVLWDSTSYLAAIGQDQFIGPKAHSQILMESYIHDGGAAIPLDINRAIKSIYVNPTSLSWYKKVIEKLCVTYDLGCPINQSSLIGTALF